MFKIIHHNVFDGNVCRIILQKKQPSMSSHPSLYGEHYRWMRIAESTDLNDDECLGIFAIAPEEEHDPSEVIFAERNQAIEYIKQDDQLSEELSDNDGNIVLCKITTSVVSHRQ